MKKTLPFLLLSLCVFSCSLQKKTGCAESGAMTFNESGESAQYDFLRFRNPLTNRIPGNIKDRELLFAATNANTEKTESLNWIHRGPNNFGGRTRAVAYDASNSHIILAGGVTGGMWRSTDDGASFQITTGASEIHSVSCIAQDLRSGKQNTWYYGTGEDYGVVSMASFSNLFSGNGIYKSTDGGSTWHVLSSTQSNTPTTQQQKADFDFVWDIVCDRTRTDSDIVLAAVYNGIWRSADGGTSWKPSLGLDTSIGGESEYTDLMQTPSGIFYAAVSAGTPSRGIWRSTDGINWTNVTPVSMSTSVKRIEMCYAPSDENTLYVIAHQPGSPTEQHKLWKGTASASTVTWIDRSNFIPNKSCVVWLGHEFGSFNSQSGYDLCIAVKPDDANTVFLCGTNVYRSTDGFSSHNYEKIGGYNCDTLDPYNYVWPNHHPDQHKILFHPDNPIKMLSANDGGLFITDNCMSSPPVWQSLNNNYATMQFYTCAVMPGNANDNFVMGGLQDNGSWATWSENASVDWVNINKGDGAYACMTHNPNLFYSSWQQGKLLKLHTGADHSVSEFTRMDPSGAAAQLFINSFILDPLDSNRMYYAGGRSIWRNDKLNYIPYTNDAANTIDTGWTKLLNTSLGSSISSPQITALDICDSDNGILYYGTTNGKLFKLVNPQYDTSHPVEITSGIFPAGAYLACVDVDYHDADKLLICFSNYETQSVFYSADGGASWSHVSGNLEEHENGTGNGPSVCWVHHYSDADTIFYLAGTTTGLYSTTTLSDSNTNWTQAAATEIGNVIVNMIASRPYDGYIAVATHGRGMFTTRLRPSNAIPGIPYTGVALEVFPVPATEDLNLSITALHEQFGLLKITDATGRTVLEKNIELETGKNLFTLDIHVLPRGAYIVQLETENENLHKAIVVN